MIIGIKDRDRVLLAYSAFDTYFEVPVEDMVLPDNTCVWKVGRNPHTVMGCGLYSAESDAFRYEEGIFKGRITCERLIDEIIPAMEKFADGKPHLSGNDRFEEFLIAQDDKLFHIEAEHIAFEEDSFCVIGGSTEGHVKGLLLATEGQPATERIRKAFEFAAKARQSFAYPISVIDTKTCKLKVLKK